MDIIRKSICHNLGVLYACDAKNYESLPDEELIKLIDNLFDKYKTMDLLCSNLCDGFNRRVKGNKNGKQIIL